MVFIPTISYAAYWEPGTAATPDVYYYTICDTIRQFCYNVDLEFLVPILHQQTPYWVVAADMTILAGFPHGMEYPRGLVAQPWRITGDPSHDMELLADLPAAGIPTYSYILLYDGVTHPPFTDQSHTLVGSLEDTIFGINDIMAGAGIVRIGESWGDMVVAEHVDGLYIIQYAGQGSAMFLVDPTRPIPLAGIYIADRYDPHIRDSMWFHAGIQYMDILLDAGVYSVVDVSGPDDVMRAGTLAGLSWVSDTFQVSSLTTSPDSVTIYGHASESGDIDIVMPAFGSRYTFWQGGDIIPAEYVVAGGVLSADITHDIGDITIYSIPDNICTGNCLEGLVVRAWDGPTAIIYGSGWHGSVRLSMAAGDPNGVAASVCPPGSIVTVDFDVIEPRRQAIALPYITTYESVLDVDIHRVGSKITIQTAGEPAAITLYMPAMTGNITYDIEPLVASIYHDTVTATIQHVGGDASYVISSDGPSAWRDGLAIPPPTSNTGVIWCGGAEPVNAMVIRDAGINQQDCGITKFGRGWNVWC